MNILDHNRIVLFTGAGMSAESGVPTYRGQGGIWHEYKWEEYACQTAFDEDPMRVLDFHELRRIEALKCEPHSGHQMIKEIQEEHDDVWIVTQNIDGIHQRAENKNVVELHGSLWRLRCENESHIFYDLDKAEYRSRKCTCGSWLRPDIVWFNDMLDPEIIGRSNELISCCDLFISIGTSGGVWPAAGYPQLARSSGALCIEINPDPSEQSHMYDRIYQETAGEGLRNLFKSD